MLAAWEVPPGTSTTAIYPEHTNTRRNSFILSLGSICIAALRLRFAGIPITFTPGANRKLFPERPRLTITQIVGLIYFGN